MTSTSRWPVLAPPAAVGLLVVGIALHAATLVYDLTHWDVAYHLSPQEAADRNGLVDLVGQLVDQLAVVLSVVVVVGLLLSVPGLVKGQRGAHVTTCLLAAPFAVCCGTMLISGTGFFPRGPDARSAGAPQHGAAPTWVHVADALAPPLLVGAAIVVLVLLYVPPVHRRFYPPQP